MYNSVFFKEINLFRAFAIVFVVFAHCSNLLVFSFNKNTINYNVIVYFFSGSTTFFVFISGFIFHFKQSKGFDFFQFFQKKLKFIFLPFLFFSQIDILYYSICLLASYLLNFSYDSSLLTNYNYLNTLLFGHSFMPIGLWFVPVILFIYLISPMLIFLTRLSNNNIFFILLLLFFISMFIHRNFDNNFIGILRNIIYFIPFFILGMFFSKNYEGFKITSPFIYIWLFLLIFISFYLQCKVGTITIFDGELRLSNLDFMVVQKLILTIVLFFLLSKIKEYNFAFINTLAKFSFGIFFIHGIIIFFINQLLRHYSFIFSTNNFMIYVLISMFILYISFLTVLFIKKIIGDNSKYFIGC